MSKDRRRRVKRAPVPQGNQGEFSRGLSYANVAHGRGDPVAALQQLDAMAAGGQDAPGKARLVAMTGDVLAGLGRLDEALAAFARAGALAADASQPEVEVRAALGEIRAALAMLDEQRARATADRTWNRMRTSSAAMDQAIDLTPAQLARVGQIAVGPRPPRASVVAHRIGTAFLQAGLAEDATEWFRRAVVATPNGAARARQTLARIALGSDDPATTERYARESLQMGRFKAKTVASWRLLVAARGRQDKRPLDADLVESLFQTCKGPVRARAVLELTRALRAYRDPDWSAPAKRWLARHRKEDEVVAVEVEKILHAEAKIAALQEGGGAGLVRGARALLNHPQATTLEMVAAAKDVVHYAGLDRRGPPADTAALAAAMARRHGPAARGKAVHAMALGAMKAKSFDQARGLLEDQIGRIRPGSPQWGRDVWALAMMERRLGRIEECVQWLFTLAEAEKTPVRFKITALTRGLHVLAKADRKLSDTRAIQRQVEGLLAGIDDYDLLLEACRQIGLAGEEFIPLRDRTRDRAVAAALKAFENATTPGQAVTILCRLTRRQSNELQQHREIVAIWHQMQKRDLAAFPAAGAVWWEYLGLVFGSLCRSERAGEAMQMYKAWVGDPATPPEGKAVLGAAQALWLLSVDAPLPACEVFESVVREAPTHPSAALAHYWLALSHHYYGRADLARHEALAVRRCYGRVPALHKDRIVDCRALLLLGGMREDPALPYDLELQRKLLNGIRMELEQFARSVARNSAN